ncbi:MAG: cupin domain-containing protein [Alteraurantiacibacter sp.]
MRSQSSPQLASEALQMLIAPLSAEQFFRDYHEKSHFHGAVSHTAMEELLTIDRIDEIIADNELPPSSIAMAKSGQSINPAEYTFANEVVDRGAVLDGFRDGSTIILPQLHLADGKLYEFCLSLEKAFGARTQTNIYMTPPGEHGFDVHYDDHDVFVLQVAGAKDRDIYGSRESLPYRGESFRKGHDDVGELEAEFCLDQGQCLYVPRGTAHRAQTPGSEPSLHITVGILVQTWADFLLEAVAEASLRIPELRQSLPRDLFFETENRDAYMAQFKQAASAIVDKASFEANLAAFSGNFVRSQGGRVRGGLAVQLQNRIKSRSLAKSDFTVDDAEELDDVIGTLVAYGLLTRD